MTNLTRYVITELMKVFLITLTGMTLLMMVAGLAQEAIRQGLGPSPILRLIPYAIPNALRFAVPGTILFAACSVYGRMSAMNEIVAIKSLGISPLRLIRPALVLAFGISLVAVWLNDLAVSWGREGMNRVILHSIEQVAYGMLRANRSYGSDRVSILVRSVEGRRLIQPYICIRGGDDSPSTTITAEEAELRLNHDKSALVVVLTNGEVRVGGQVTMTFPDTISPEIPLREVAARGGSSNSPSGIPMWRLEPETVAQIDQISKRKQRMAIEAAFQLATGDFAGLQEKGWAQHHAALQGGQSRLHRLQTEPWRRWANGFSCLFFVMVGAPLAVRMRNSDIWSSFATCFFPILVAYYPLLIFGADRAKSGDLPPCVVWLGNIILAVASYVVLRKVQRY
jgi:lipopolysaccharide export system permease protein